MIIYRLSIVERDLSYGNPDTKIVDFVEDFEFRKFERLEAKLKQLLKKGLTIDQLDVTTWEKDNDTYDITYDPFDSLTSLIDSVS